MQFSLVKSCLLALAATTSVLAQTPGWNVITKPAMGEVVAAGETYTIVWQASTPDEPISLILMQGKTNTTLVLGETIAAGIDSGKGTYDWAVPATAGDHAVYGVMVKSDADPETFQYSNQFKIGAGAGGDDEEEEEEPKPTTTIRVSQVSTITSTSISSSTEESTSTTSTTSSSSSKITSSSTTEIESSSEPTTFTTVAPSTSTEVVIVEPTETEDEEPAEETSPIAVVPEGAAGSVAVRGGVVVAALALALFA